MPMLSASLTEPYKQGQVKSLRYSFAILLQRMHACMLTHFLFDAFRTQRVQVLKRIVAVARGLSEKTKGSDDKAGSLHDFCELANILISAKNVMFQALRSSASTDSLGIDDAPEDCFVVFRAHGKT